MEKQYPMQVIFREPPPSYFDLTNQSNPRPPPSPPDETRGFSTVDIGSLNSLEAVITSQEVFIFRAMEKIGLNISSLIVQIRGGEDQILMSALTTRHPSGSSGEHGRTTDTVTCTDPYGRSLLTFTESGATIVVNGDRLFGVIDREGSPVCSLNLKAKNTLGEVVFRTLRTGDQVDFYSRGGTLMATAKNQTTEFGNEFVLEFLVPLDYNNRVLMLAAAYYLNIFHYVETACGCHGVVSLCKCFCVAPIVILFSLVLIIGILVFVFQY